MNVHTVRHSLATEKQSKIHDAASPAVLPSSKRTRFEGVLRALTSNLHQEEERQGYNAKPARQQRQSEFQKDTTAVRRQ